MKKTVTIKYGFDSMDAALQWSLIETLAKDIEKFEEDGQYNPEDKAISRLAGSVFTISNEHDTTNKSN